MSHVDEGLLHAYIDGALEAESPERIEIELHLAACADCRVRLEDALQTKHAAAKVLDSVAPPGSVDMPSWETIAAEHARRSGAAGSASPRRARRPFIPLAWAASLLVALGAGWMARVMLAERDMSEGFEESEALMMPVSEMDEERASVFDSAPANLQRAAQPAAAPPRAEIPAPSVVPSTNEGLRQRRDALMEKAAAGITLSGEVRDSATGQPLAGASITVPGTPLGGITDSTGRFRIPNVPAGNVALEAKVLGYADARRIIDLRDDSIPSVRFRLEQHPVTLDQIVVTGEAAAPRRRQLGNALSSIVMAWRPASIAEVRDSLGTEPVVLADATPDSVFMRSIDGRPVVRMVYTVEGEILELEQSRSIAEEDLARGEASVDSTSTINVRDLSVTLKGAPALLESFRRRLR